MRKIFGTLLITGLILAGTALPAKAETLPAPRADYDADIAVDIGGKSYPGHVNASGPRERRTANVSGHQQTIIDNRATGEIFLLVPGFNTAIQIPPSSLGGFDINQIASYPVRRDGEEDVAGLRTIRYQVNGQNAQGSFSGHAWVTDSGIIARIDGVAVHNNNQQTPVRLELQNVHLRAQDPSLFALPTSPQGMPMDLSKLLGGHSHQN